MALYRDDAIVLRRLDYSETSLVLLMLCRAHGAQRLIAKGVKRSTKQKASVGIDLLESGHVVYSRRDGGTAQLATMTEWKQLDLHADLRRDLKSWYAGQYAAEVTAGLMEEGDPHAGLYEALEEFLSLGHTHVLPRLVQYQCALLRAAGLLPGFTECAACGNDPDDESVYFSSRQGGLICRDCEPAMVEKRRITAPAVALLNGRVHAANSHDYASPNGVTMPAEANSAAWLEAFELLDYHTTETLAHPPRLSGPLRQALRQK